MSIATSVPTIKVGQSLKFKNLDSPLGNGIWHTITACRLPCDGKTGIAFPLADAKVVFDSGELGIADEPASGVDTWSTPTNMPPGTYTYFCRIHPFMRGAFRVVAG
jgi:plastocyanin